MPRNKTSVLRLPRGSHCQNSQRAPLGCDIVSGSRQGAVQAARDEVQTRADERESNLRTQHKKELADLQQQLFEAQHACKSLKDEQRPRRISHLSDPGTREEERRKVCEEIVHPHMANGPMETHLRPLVNDLGLPHDARVAEPGIRNGQAKG